MIINHPMIKLQYRKILQFFISVRQDGIYGKINICCAGAISQLLSDCSRWGYDHETKILIFST